MANMQQPKQKVVVPKGTIDDSKVAVIEIPLEYKDLPVVVVVPKGSSSTKPFSKTSLSQNNGSRIECPNMNFPGRAIQPLAHPTAASPRNIASPEPPSVCPNKSCPAKVSSSPTTLEPAASKSKPPTPHRRSLRGPDGCSNTTCPSRTGSMRSSASPAILDQVEEAKSEPAAEESPPAGDSAEEAPPEAQPPGDAEPTDKADEVPQPENGNDEAQKAEDENPETLNGDKSSLPERQASKSGRSSADLEKIPKSGSKRSSIDANAEGMSKRSSAGSDKSSKRDEKSQSSKPTDNDGDKHKCCKCPAGRRASTDVAKQQEVDDEAEDGSADESNEENDDEENDADYNVLGVSPPDEVNDDLQYYDTGPSNRDDANQASGYKCGCASPDHADASFEPYNAGQAALSNYGYSYGAGLKQPSPVSNGINRNNLGAMPPNRYYNANPLGRVPPYEMNRTYSIETDPARSRLPPSQSSKPVKQIITTVTEATNNGNLDGNIHPVYKKISKTTTITQVPADENMRSMQPIGRGGCCAGGRTAPSNRPNYVSNNVPYPSATYSRGNQMNTRYGPRYAPGNVNPQAEYLQQPVANMSRPAPMACYPPNNPYSKNDTNSGRMAPYKSANNYQWELPSKDLSFRRGHSSTPQPQSRDSNCKCTHHTHDDRALRGSNQTDKVPQSQRPSRSMQPQIQEDFVKDYEDARRRLVADVAKIGQL